MAEAKEDVVMMIVLGALEITEEFLNIRRYLKQYDRKQNFVYHIMYELNQKIKKANPEIGNWLLHF